MPPTVFFPALDSLGNGPPVSKVVSKILAQRGWGIVFNPSPSKVTHSFICAWEPVAATHLSNLNREMLLSLASEVTILSLGHTNPHLWLTRFSSKVRWIRSIGELDDWIGEVVQRRTAAHA